MGTGCVCACLDTNISKKRHLHRYLYFWYLFHNIFPHQDRNRIFLKEGLGKRTWRFWYDIRIAMTALMSSNPSWKRDVTETRRTCETQVQKKNCPFIPWLFSHPAPGMMQSVHDNYPRSTWELSDLLRNRDNSKRKSNLVVPRTEVKVLLSCVRDTKYCWCFPTISFSLSFQKQRGFERATIGEIIHMERWFPE